MFSIRYKSLIICSFFLLLLTACSDVMMQRRGDYYENIISGDKVGVAEEQLPKSADGLHVAMLLPLDGESTELGQHLLDAAQLAIHDLGSNNVRLIPINTTGDNSSLQQAVDKIIADKIDIILGPVFAKEAGFIHTKLRAAGKEIPILTLSNDISLLNKKGMYLFGIMPDQQVRRIIQYSWQHGHKNIAALLPDNHYGNILEAVVSHPQEEVRTMLVAKYNPQNHTNAVQEINSSLLNIQNSAADALLIADGGVVARDILQQMQLIKAEDKHIQLLAISNWGDDAALRKLPMAKGAWFANLPMHSIAKFEHRFNENVGYKPVRISVLAYDALIFIASLKKTHGSIRSSDFLNDAGFRGVTGVFRLNADGYVDRGLSIYEITSNGVKEIESAPHSLD